MPVFDPLHLHDHNEDDHDGFFHEEHERHRASIDLRRISVLNEVLKTTMASMKDVSSGINNNSMNKMTLRQIEEEDETDNTEFYCNNLNYKLFRMIEASDKGFQLLELDGSVLDPEEFDDDSDSDSNAAHAVKMKSNETNNKNNNDSKKKGKEDDNDDDNDDDTESTDSSDDEEEEDDDDEFDDDDDENTKERNNNKYCNFDDSKYNQMYAELLRALCMNTSLKAVHVRDTFLCKLNPNKVRIVLEVIGRLPLLEELTIHFPNRMQRSSTTSIASLLYSAVRHGGTNLKRLEVIGLRLIDEENCEEESEELATGFAKLEKLQQLVLLDFIVFDDVDVDPFLETLSDLPMLSTLEIRLKRKEELNGMFFQQLCASKTLQSLILWNMILDSVQTTHICEGVTASTNLKNFEIWRCDFGPTFGILLAGVLQDNKSLETMIVADVPFYGTGVVSLTNSLKRNHTLRDLKLLNIGKGSSCTTASKAAVQMMEGGRAKTNQTKKNDGTLCSVYFHFDNISHSDCLALDKFFRMNHDYEKLKQEQEQKKIDRHNKRKQMLHGITLGYCGISCILEKYFQSPNDYKHPTY